MSNLQEEKVRENTSVNLSRNEVSINNEFLKIIHKIEQIEDWTCCTPHITSPKDTMRWLCSSGHEFLLSINEYAKDYRCRKCTRTLTRMEQEEMKRVKEERKNRIKQIKIIEPLKI